jgi:UDP-glucose 4-epimerase
MEMRVSETILVTGGAGYVGSHCVAALIRGGARVVVFDNLEHGHRAAVPKEATFIEGDLADAALVSRVVSKHRIGAVLHFAAYALVGESMSDPFKYLGDNVTNALNLIRATTEAGIRKFVLSSTCNLFGKPDRIPIEEDAAIDAGSPYGESKFITERMLHWADKIYGLRSACLRYFNAAGAHPDGILGEDHDPETHLIPIVLDVALGRRPHVQIFGDDYPTPDGTCVRDYIHVCDLADAHLKALEILETRSCHYNLGTGHGYSVKQVVEAARRVTGRGIAVKIGPRRPGDPAMLVASAARAMRELGWAPRHPSLEEIIATAWRWKREHPAGYGEQDSLPGAAKK